MENSTSADIGCHAEQVTEARLHYSDIGALDENLPKLFAQTVAARHLLRLKASAHSLD